MYYLRNQEHSLIPYQIKFQILDKGYVTEKEFKKLAKTYKDIATYSANNENDFHIKILNQ